ncbi:inosine-5'-monophosphate dehydrogenase [bacterium BMS3Abin02]|nr:inosine-5'-monophosphate dehydrogenase [bacterium BMS3Abin02]GBE22424.1 inosine-5'-monophosphate dehydrogenase [bacterium BMS3Bbin01]
MRVLDIMTMDVLTTSPSASLKEAARTMVRSGVSGLPVLGESGELVGIITEADFLEREADRSRRRLLDAMLKDRDSVVDAETVGEVMTRDPVVIFPEASVTEAARVMAHHHVKRLPVVGAEGKLIGIISRADVVAVFTRPDDVIEDEIREDIIRRVLLLEADSIDVTVKDGVVEVSGAVPTATDARLLEELIRRIDGVVRVVSHITFDVDDA